MHQCQGADLQEKLCQWFKPWRSCAVALSGGVDSAVVAAAAFRSLGTNAVALTARSASVADSELHAAQEVAAFIGIRHYILDTYELDNPLYARNQPDRCFHCKTELYERIQQWLARTPVEVVVNGTNVEDLGDYRPGLLAAQRWGVRSPLAECGFTKQHVRQLAQYWNLPVWDKPASPCLASRIAYGESVTPERLAMIEQAEAFLKKKGFSQVRVRFHSGNLARVEVPVAELPRLISDEVRSELVDCLTKLGFVHITVDLAGFRSGSLNAGLSLVALQPAAPGNTDG